MYFVSCAYCLYSVFVLLYVFLFVVCLFVYRYCLLSVEEELAAERAKLYQSIGYSEDAKAAIYPKEVSTCVQSISQCCVFLCVALFATR